MIKNTKKHMPGFVPVNFKQSGKILFTIGLVSLIIKAVSYLTNWFTVPNYFVYFGAGLILLSLYLIFVVPKE